MDVLGFAGEARGCTNCSGLARDHSSLAGLGQQGQGTLRGWQQDGKSPAEIPGTIASPQLGNVPARDPAARADDAHVCVEATQTQHIK